MLRIRFYPWRRENIYFFTEKNFDADIVRKLLKQDKIVELRAITIPKELVKRIHRGFTTEMTKHDERTDITLSCIRGMVAKKDMIKVFLFSLFGIKIIQNLGIYKIFHITKK